MARSSTETREKILKATRSLYSTHGFVGTTLDDVLTASGVTKGAFYHYFKTKESVCQDVLDSVIEDYKRLFGSIDPQLSSLEQLQELIRQLEMLNASGQWVNCRLMLRLTAESGSMDSGMRQKLKTFWRWQASVYEELISSAQMEGDLSDRVDAARLAQVLLSTVAGAIVLDKTMTNPKGFVELAANILQEFIRVNPLDPSDE